MSRSSSVRPMRRYAYNLLVYKASAITCPNLMNRIQTQLPPDYIELEKRVDALKAVHQKLYSVTYAPNSVLATFHILTRPPGPNIRTKAMTILQTSANHSMISVVPSLKRCISFPPPHPLPKPKPPSQLLPLRNLNRKPSTTPLPVRPSPVPNS